MIGISFFYIWQIDKANAKCKKLGNLTTEFNGLTYVPTASGARLIGAANNGDVFEINPANGASTKIGAFGTNWLSSGDLVSISGLGTFATVKKSGDTVDTLARINEQTGQATAIGKTGFDKIWGLGYWSGKFYGFTEDREFVLINPQSGATSLVAGSGQTWWGAGVETDAPLVDP
jgi:hypothetical protein